MFCMLCVFCGFDEQYVGGAAVEAEAAESFRSAATAALVTQF